jgi:MFS family permease
LRGRDFRILVASSGLSALGDELALIALTIKVANLTESGWDVAALLLAGLLPLVIFAPAAGVIVDNFETRRTFAIVSGLQAALALALALTTGLPTILLFAFLLGACTAVANPALYTLVPAVVGDEEATPANAYLETARYAGMIAGPILAGTISFRVGAKVALLVDAGTFVAIFLAALALQVRRDPQGTSEQAAAGEARAGLAIVWGDHLLTVAFSVFAAIVLFGAMDNVAEVFFARDTLHAGSWGYGVLAAAWIVGLVIGASVIARRLPTNRLVPAMMMGGVVAGVAVASAAAVPVMILAIVMFVVGGIANGVVTVPMRSVIVHRVADRSRGRVFAAYGGVANGVQIAAMAIAGGLVVALGGRTALLIGGVGTAVAGLAGLAWYRLLSPEVRWMGTGDAEPPDVSELGLLVDTIEVAPHPDAVMRIPDAEADAEVTTDH